MKPRMAPFTEPFESFVAPARASPELWRLALGIVLIGFVYIAVLLGLDAIASLFVAGGAPSFVEPVQTPWPMIYLLFSFSGLALAPILIAAMLHGRDFASLLGPGPLRHGFSEAAKVMLGLQLFYVLLISATQDVSLNQNFGAWLLILPIALAGLVLQTGAEELFFRGYILQQAAARFRSPWIWALGPAVFFGLSHYGGAEAPIHNWLIVVSITVYALVATDLVTATGNLGAAWGMHFGVNVVNILVIAPSHSLSGLSLFTVDLSADAYVRVLFFYMIALLIGWAAIRRRLVL